MDLTFLIDVNEAISVRNNLIDELESWNGILSVDDTNRYYGMIASLNLIIDHLIKTNTKPLGGK